MKSEPSEPVIAESYPTFWDETAPSHIAQSDPVEDAYTTFVNLADDDLPADVSADAD